MKKLLCMILVVSFVGCTRNDMEFSQTASTTETEIRLVCGGETEKLEHLTKAFEKETPEIKITVITTDPNDDFALATKALFSGNRPPVLVLTQAEHLNSLAEYFADLANEAWVNDALPNALSEVSREGKIVAMPVELEGIGFVYDKRVFEAAKINPENINSIERLTAVAEYLSQKLSELKEEFQSIDSVFTKPDEQTLKYLANAVVSQEYASSLDLANAQLELTFAEGFNTLLSLMQSHFSSNGIMTLQSHKSSDEANNTDMLPVSILGASQDSIILNVPTYLAVNKNCTKKEQNAALKFLSWVACSETSSTITAEKLGWISPFANASKTPDAPIAKTVLKYAVSGKTMPYVLNGIDQEIYNNIKSRLLS